MSLKVPDSVKNCESTFGGDTEEFVNVRVTPTTGEQLRTRENDAWYADALQSTSRQSFETEHSVSSS